MPKFINRCFLFSFNHNCNAKWNFKTIILNLKFYICIYINVLI